MTQDNFILPFQLETSQIRGRVVRMDGVLDDILSAHDYPEDILQLTGEVAMLCAMLSSMLKYDGVFTLQAQGDGPVKMVVADMMSGGGTRACATFSEGAALSYGANRAELLGKGYMAFTVDQGEHMERYQGIVELKPESLIASVQHYFTQSDQIGTGMMMEVGRVNGKWRGCGIMVQQMPGEGGTVARDKSNVDEDDWRRTMILLGSVKREELLSPAISVRDLLYRLFHEEGVRVFDTQDIHKTCRCSAERLESILFSMPKDEIDDMVVDGKITMTCEFCSTHYTFNPDDIRKGKQE